MAAPKRPGGVNEEQGIAIERFEILSCSECGGDRLFAVVHEKPTTADPLYPRRTHYFCSGCGRYFEKGGEHNGS